MTKDASKNVSKSYHCRSSSAPLQCLIEMRKLLSLIWTLIAAGLRFVILDDEPYMLKPGSNSTGLLAVVDLLGHFRHITKHRSLWLLYSHLVRLALAAPSKGLPTYSPINHLVPSHVKAPV